MDKIKDYDRDQLSTLAKKLKYYRKKKNFTQQTVANAIGVRRSTYAYYEKNTNPPTETLKKLANFFDVSIDELCSEKYNYVFHSTQNLDYNVAKEPQRTIKMKVTSPKNTDFHLLTNEEFEFIKKLRDLTIEQQNRILNSL